MCDVVLYQLLVQLWLLDCYCCGHWYTGTAVVVGFFVLLPVEFVALVV
jgi:hypothetical protein